MGETVGGHESESAESPWESEIVLGSLLLELGDADVVLVSDVVLMSLHSAQGDLVVEVVHTLADMTVAAIDQIHSRNTCVRKIRESRWIRTLGTSYPSGFI